jgi:hypothetical protein
MKLHQQSSEKGERPVGVPAARGHGGDGGADIRGGLRGPEHIVSVPLGGGGVDRPLGSFSASTKVLERYFAAFSPVSIGTCDKPRAEPPRGVLALQRLWAVIEWGSWRW